MSLLLLLLITANLVDALNNCQANDVCECISSNGVVELQCPKNNSWINIEGHFPKKYLKIQCTDQENHTKISFNNFDVPESIYAMKLESLSIYFCPKLNVLNNIKTENIKTLRYVSNKQNFRIDQNDLGKFKKLNILEINDANLSLNKQAFIENTNLKVLNLRNNQLKKLDYYFDELQELTVLDLSENLISFIPNGTFKNLKNLKTLQLWKNKLTCITNDNFVGLSNLKVLEMFGNSIEVIEKNAFLDLGNLTILNLKNNSIKSFHKSTFSQNKKLEYINLSQNPNLILSNHMFCNLTNLKKVTLEHSKIEKLPDHLFEGCKNLNEINVRSNKLKSIPQNVFLGLTRLTSLDLSQNNLQHLTERMFLDLESLSKLKLNNNELEEIPTNVLTGLANLQELYLNNNQIHQVDFETFVDLISLQKIDMSFNNWSMPLHYVALTSALGACSELQEIILSHNNVERFPSELLEFLPQIRLMNLSYNPIQDLSVTDFTKIVIEPLIVDLSNTKITSLDFYGATYIAQENLELNGQEAVEFKTTIFLNNTQMRCGCENYNLLQYNAGLFPDVRKLVDIRQETIFCRNSSKFKKLLDVTPEICAYKIDKYCPDKCSCSFRPFNKTLNIDCSYKNLTNYPSLDVIVKKAGFKFNQTTVNLEGNSLNNIPEDWSYENVTVLNVKSNQIEEIFWLPANIQEINLDNNNLKTLNRSCIEMLTNTTTFKKITLRNNPWVCDCNIRHLQLFLLKFYEKADSSEILCSEDLIPISTATNLCPQSLLLIVALPVVLTFLFLLALTTTIYFRYQQEIKSFLFVKGWLLWFVTEEELDKDKRFDLFLSYANQDANFAEETLLTELENDGFKVCVHFRDFTPGEFIPQNIINSVQNSRRTVIVLSNNFVNSVWGRLEFRTAHTESISEGRARIIVIIYGDLNVDCLDDELKSYLKMNTYVKWGDKYFWHKLKYALPHDSSRGRSYVRNKKYVPNLVKIDISK